MNLEQLERRIRDRPRNDAMRRAVLAIRRALGWRDAGAAAQFVEQLGQLEAADRLSLARVAVRALEPRDRGALAAWLAKEQRRAK